MAYMRLQLRAMDQHRIELSDLFSQWMTRMHRYMKASLSYLQPRVGVAISGLLEGDGGRRRRRSGQDTLDARLERAVPTCHCLVSGGG